MSNSTDKKWFVLTSKTRDEQRAFDNLQSQGYTVFLPKISRVRKKQGKKTVSLEPLFPSYLFIQLDNKADNFNAIRSTRGVGHFVRFGLNHATIPNSIIDQIKKDVGETQEEAKTLEELLNFKAGDKVNITEGPLKGLEAVYKTKDGLERSILMVKMLGQENEVAVDNDILDPQN